MVGKIKAALDARRNTDTLIIARTDARAVEGLDSALERGEAYCDAGADVLFIEAPQSWEEMKFLQTFSGRIPLLANMVEVANTYQRGAGPCHWVTTWQFFPVEQYAPSHITCKLIIADCWPMAVIRLLLTVCMISMA